MPQPTQTDAHLDAILTGISTAYMNNPGAFIATQVAPVIPVDKQSDKYYTFTKADWFRDEAALRADSTESVGSGYTLSTDRYQADVWAFHKDIGDQYRANYDNPLNPDREATLFVTQRMMLRQELDWVATYFGTSIWGNTDQTGVDAAPGANQFLRWNDAASDPINDIENAKRTILATTGFLPNTLVLGYDVFRWLKQHPDIIDRIKYTSSQNITVELLARMFEVDRVFVCTSIKNTANEGATASYSFVHGKSALLCYVAPAPSLMTPSAMYTFMWRGVSDGLGATVGISRFRMQHLRADRIEAQMAWDFKVVSSDLGVFLSTAVA